MVNALISRAHCAHPVHAEVCAQLGERRGTQCSARKWSEACLRGDRMSSVRRLAMNTPSPAVVLHVHIRIFRCSLMPVHIAWRPQRASIPCTDRLRICVLPSRL